MFGVRSLELDAVEPLLVDREAAGERAVRLPRQRPESDSLSRIRPLGAFIVALVVPELQTRGVMKQAYAPGTLRQKLFGGVGAAAGEPPGGSLPAVNFLPQPVN